MQEEITTTIEHENNWTKTRQTLFWIMIFMFGVALCLGAYLYIF
jgi:hypothetical protein